jgi:hypothetical protein
VSIDSGWDRRVDTGTTGSAKILATADPVCISRGGTLSAAKGIDTLEGGEGADRLLGGHDADGLTEGAGADVVVYQARREGGDHIRDFTQGEDLIDPSEMAPVLSKPGDPAFRFAGESLTSVARSVTFHFVGDATVIEADPGGKAGAEFQITLDSRVALTATDVILWSRTRKAPGVSSGRPGRQAPTIAAPCR